VAVTVAHETRPSLSRFTFVFLALAISVFTWGLQYKLSLYDPPHSTSHDIPEAKLLSRNEQSTVTEGSFVTSTEVWPLMGHVVSFALLAFSFLRFNLTAGPRWIRQVREARRPWRVPRRPGLSAFFFRPPPALI
jgi:hypothetical protein